MPVSVKQIVWLSGLLEGEGNFGISSSNSPRIRLYMTDADVVETAKNIMQPTLTIYTRQREKGKDAYYFSIGGKKAIEWMMTLYPLMGLRRKSKIRECILFWKSTESRHVSAQSINVQQARDLQGLSKRLRKSGYDDSVIELALGMKRLGYTDEKINIDLLNIVSLKKEIM